MDDLTKEIASLIIVDDDEIFRKRLLSAMEKKGYYVTGFGTIKESIQYIEKTPPNYAVIDLRLGDGNGLQVVSVLSKLKPECKIVILTGYGNIPTAVAAVEEGACDYLAKPADERAREQENKRAREQASKSTRKQKSKRA